MTEQPRTGLKIPVGIFGIHSQLNRVPAGRQPMTQRIQWRQFPRRLLQHPLHQIHRPDHLGDAVLNL